MRTHSFAVVVAAVVFAATNFVSDASLAQSPRATAAVQTATAKPIGKVVSVSGTVTIEHVNAVVVQVSAGNRNDRIKAGDPVYLGDIVQTGADGKLGVTFADDTAFNLTSNARMEMNQFVYDPNSKSNSSVFKLTEGAITLVAGKVAKTGGMKIDTPVATMGIRGTMPHIEIARDGSVKFSTLFEEGKAEVLQKYRAPRAAPPPAETTKPRKKIDLNICKGC
jgi:hypothetical protein